MSINISDYMNSRKAIYYLCIGAMLLSWIYAHAEEEKGEISLPSRWNTDSLDVTSAADDAAWWQLFGDASLNRLLRQGEEGNYSLKGALRRIEASKMAVKSARAGYMPTVNATAGWNASRSSGRTTAQFAETQKISYFTAGLDMSWEIDVFGRVAAQVKGKKASLAVSKADFEGALLSVKANMAKDYFALCLAREQMDVAQSQLESQRKILHITEVRKETGLSSGLDVAQATTTVISTQTTIPTLRASEQNAINAMALLAGCHPEAVDSIIGANGASQLPAIPTSLPIGIPADMISSRPDIEAARKQIDLCAAQLGLTRKDWLPTLSVTASAGTSATRIDDMFSKGSYYWQVAPQLSWTVFDGLERKYAGAEARLNLEAAVDDYNETVLTAWSEVENALSQYRCALDRMKYEEELLVQAQKTFDYSLDLYKQGLVDFTNVQDAQVSSLNARNSILSAHYDALTSLVTLFQALGLNSTTE